MLEGVSKPASKDIKAPVTKSKAPPSESIQSQRATKFKNKQKRKVKKATENIGLIVPNPNNNSAWNMTRAQSVELQNEVDSFKKAMTTLIR